MIDPAVLTVRRAELWRAVNTLTQTAKQPIARDDGTITFASTPSLWDQTSDALTGGLEATAGAGNAFERAPVDLALMTARTLISATTRRALIRRQQRPRQTVPAQLRQLAGYAVTHEPDRVPAHGQRFDGWVRLLTGRLATVHTVTTVRLRNSCCPTCGARMAVVDGPDGPVVVPALVVGFEAGLVRAAQCLLCGASWFRGDAIEALAALLGCPAVA